MAWNQPGERKQRATPRGASGDSSLDEQLRRWQQRVQQMWRPGRSGRTAAVSLLLLALIVWLASGFYDVAPNERGVLQRFGRYVATASPGSGWHWPWPVDSLTKVDVETAQALDSKSQMMTSDQGLLQISWSMRYRCSDPVACLFDVREPTSTLRQAAETELRELVAGSTLQSMLRGETREVLGAAARERTQRLLDDYRTGVTVTDVAVNDVQLPDSVQASEAAAAKAAEERQSAVGTAQTAAAERLSKAQGEAQQMLADAQVYASRTVADAQGEASRIGALEDEYARAPQATRSRLYIDTMQAILSRPRKIVLDTKGSGNMIYLPIDKLLEAGRSGGAVAQTAAGTAGGASTGTPGTGTAAATAPAAAAVPGTGATAAGATESGAPVERARDDERSRDRDRPERP